MDIHESIRETARTAGRNRKRPSQSLRAICDRIVLELLLERGSITRSEIVKVTGLSKPTVSQIVLRLIDAGLVVQDGVIDDRTPGPNALLYRLNPGAAFVGGIDVTPERVTAAVADLIGTVLGECEVSASDSRSGSADPLVRALDGAVLRSGIDRSDLHRVAIGIPGAVDPATREISYLARLQGWDRLFVEGLPALLGVDVTVENDVNLVGIVEQRIGCAVGLGNVVTLWIGPGVGLSIAIGGEIYRGATGGAGEVGHLPIVAAVPAPGQALGESVNFERLAGAAAVLELAGRFGVVAPTAAEAVRCAVADRRAGSRQFLGELADRVAVGLATITATLDPQIIVLSGDLLIAGGPPLRTMIEDRLYRLIVPRPELRTSTIAGNAVLAGALCAALDKTRSRVFSATDGV